MGTMSLMSQESTKISVAMEFAFGQIVILTLRIGENAGDRAVLQCGSQYPTWLFSSRNVASLE